MFCSVVFFVTAFVFSSKLVSFSKRIFSMEVSFGSSESSVTECPYRGTSNELFDFIVV